jgi:hypothetical protein
MAGNYRNGIEMKLIDCKGRIDLEELTNWLSKYPGLAPKTTTEERKISLDTPGDIMWLPKWVQNELIRGIDKSKGRNNRWFAIGIQCGLLGWSEDDTIHTLSYFFIEEKDFGRREWETAVRRGVRKARS